MPDTVESNLDGILKGLPLLGEEAEICDFTLEDQIKSLETQGIQPKIDSKYSPILGETITYVVACVILNEHGDVLMMQEAKESCVGLWYLPAGRMNKGETVVEACEREVLEETGLIINCTTILMIESAQYWCRLVLTGKVIGGTLKTTDEADKESLQAKWISNIDELSLRATDIKKLIEKARSYYNARKLKDSNWHPDQLPALKEHRNLLLRLVIVIKKKANNRLHVLLGEQNAWHLPTCNIHPEKGFRSTLRRFMIYLFGADVATHKPHGLLSIEHDGRNGNDGVCFTLLVSFRNPLEEVPIIGKCVWHEISKELGDKLLHRVMSRNGTFQLF